MTGMSAPPDPPLPAPAATPPETAPAVRRRIELDGRSVWRAAWVVVLIGLLVFLARFFVINAGSFIFVMIMSLFFALAAEPVVARLARWMPRAAAAAVVLFSSLALMALFFWLFGSMLTDQVSALIQALPDVADNLLKWVNTRFGTSYAMETILEDIGLDQEKITSYATSVAGDLLTIVGGIASSALNIFSFLFFVFYLSAGMPQLRTWIAGLVRPQHQVVFLTVWQTMLIKVGGYVGARIILAVINGTAMGIFMFATDMPYWLPLALWTGLVAQFVPNIGTYIAIALPVLVGATSAEPMDGVWVLAFAIAYQQVENIFIEPRISSKAVDVHPAVSFASALVGAQLFGLAGATLGVPVAATIMAVFDIYKRRWEVSAATEEEVAALIRGRIAEPPARPEPPSEGEHGLDALTELATEREKDMKRKAGRSDSAR